MKKLFYCKFIAILLLLCILSGCSNGPKGVGAGLSSQSHKLTQEQMLADYDTMWKDIDENYPLMGVAERTTGKDLAKIKAQYRADIPNVKSDREFYGVLQTCITEFEECGHLSLLDEKLYPQYMSVYKKYQNSSKGRYLFNILNNPASKTFYRYVPIDTYKQAEETASEQGESGNINTKIMEKNKIAYLGIKSFESQLVAVDAPKIAEFFNQIKNYQDCIIDIRGNGGGDTNYWLNNIVTPNLDRDVNYIEYELIKGEIAKQYLSIVQKLHPISEFKKLPNTNEEDLAQMSYFTESTDTVESKTGKKVFSGKFYLLTDGKVYSSSEALAFFCKQSGFAKIIGEPTNGDGVGTDPLLFVLPNSGIIFRFSASLGLNPDGGSNEEFGTQPDFPCAQGKDALQTCIDVIKKANIDTIAA